MHAFTAIIYVPSQATNRNGFIICFTTLDAFWLAVVKSRDTLLRSANQSLSSGRRFKKLTFIWRIKFDILIKKWKRKKKFFSPYDFVLI